MDKRSLQVRKQTYYCQDICCFPGKHLHFLLFFLWSFNFLQLVLVNLVGTVMEKLHQSKTLDSFRSKGLYLTVGEAVDDLSSSWKHWPQISLERFWQFASSQNVAFVSTDILASYTLCISSPQLDDKSLREYISISKKLEFSFSFSSYYL